MPAFIKKSALTSDRVFTKLHLVKHFERVEFCKWAQCGLNLCVAQSFKHGSCDRVLECAKNGKLVFDATISRKMRQITEVVLFLTAGDRCLSCRNF